MSNSIQLRGNCPLCGRLQAVQNGHMSKHGYEVENHWFVGVCSGERFPPMQHSRVATEQAIAATLAKVAQLRALADKLHMGIEFPALITKSTRSPKEAPTKLWEEGSAHEQEYEITRQVWAAEQRAKAGEEAAAMLGELLDAVHGTALVQVEKKAPAAPIARGERRTTERGTILQATRIEGARVYWKTEAGRQGWTGTQAWRKYTLTA
jgi:hypothetical protein